MSEAKTEIANLLIPDKEKENIDDLTKLLNKTATELKYNITTEVVGGVLTKEWPRKDIDILVNIQNSVKYQKMSDQVGESFKILGKIVNTALRGNSRFKIDHSINPYEDPEFGNAEMIIHNGSILVVPSEGVPIELINNPK